MGPNGMHPRVLRELADVIAEPLSTIFVLEDRRGARGWEENQCHSSYQKGQEGGPRELQAGQPHLHPWKEIMEVIIKQVEENMVIRSSQHGFIKGKSCLTILISFNDGMTSWVDEGGNVEVVYLDFSKAFDTVSHSILSAKLRRYGLDEWTVRSTENWLNGRAQRVVISGAEPSWRPCN